MSSSLARVQAAYVDCRRKRIAKNKTYYPMPGSKGATNCKDKFVAFYRVSPDRARAAAKGQLKAHLDGIQRAAAAELQLAQAEAAAASSKQELAAAQKKRAAAVAKLKKVTETRKAIIAKAKKRKERLKKKAGKVQRQSDRLAKAKTRIQKLRAQGGKAAPETAVADEVILDQAPLTEDTAFDLFIEEDLAEEFPDEMGEPEARSFPILPFAAGAAALVIVIALLR